MGPWAHGAQPGGLLLDENELRAMYRAYRRRQARRLVAMLPREAIRPLYRAALDAAAPSDADRDPLEILVDHCGRLLPLPPFPVWRDDLLASPDAHLREAEDSHEAPTAARPVTLAARAVRHEGGVWEARLRAFPQDGAWRGYVAFERSGAGASCRTAVVFREHGPEDLRDRFLEFEPVALEAFLRSSLP